MEESYKPIAQTQRRIHPTMKEVVSKEVETLLKVGMIYSISNNT